MFTPGCNFRCGMCHNPEFVLPEEIDKIRASFIGLENFFSFLGERKGLLDGVVITGGEPTIQAGLADFVSRIKESGFQVKLDTNGNKAADLEDLLTKGLLDYVAMDIKTSPGCYKEFSGVGVSLENIKKSIKLIMESGLEYEFRSTLIKGMHSPEVLEEMAQLITGSQKAYLQGFRPGRTLKAEFAKKRALAPEEMAAAAKIFSKHVEEVFIRN